ncbi:MAG: hypothetical protein K2Q12_07170 [Rickettsiales bacterium]|nr:hypothetical protein [Rickettsiales bacterium]
MEKTLEKDDIKNWLDSLHRAFKYEGLTGGRIFYLDQREKVFERHVSQKYNGFAVVLDCFFDFFIEVLDTKHALLAKEGWPSNGWFSIILQRYHTFFHDLRACWLMYINGYPMAGVGYLRDVFDRAVVLAAVFNGYAEMQELYGIQGDAFDEKTYKAKIQDCRKRCFSQMIGDNSNLSDESKATLRFIKDISHQQVHSAIYTDLQSHALMQKGILNYMPHPNETNEGMFINRFTEIAWFVHRLLCFIQTKPYEFSQSQQVKWELLDSSFERIIFSTHQQLDKDFPLAYIEATKTKFAFHPSSSFSK